jgi:hypothetical protein
MCTLVTQMFCLMCHTQELWLFSKNIGDAGLTALAKAAESGALAQLNTLSLRQNHIGDACISFLAAAVGSGALDSIEAIESFGNPGNSS